MSLHDAVRWNFTSLYLYFPRNMPSKSVMVRPCRVWPVWFIVLNYSARPKMVIKIYFIFFLFFKGFRAVWYRATHIWLLIGTSFASLTRNQNLTPCQTLHLDGIPVLFCFFITIFFQYFSIKFGLYLGFSDRFCTTRNSVLCRIYRKSVITIQIWFNWIGFRKCFSVLY